MEFGKIDFENRKEYDICEFNKKLNENIKIKEEKIIIGKLITEKNIISYENIIVIGDIECNYLSVSGDLLCTGSIKCKDLDVERNLYHTENINILGSKIINGKDIILKNIKIKEEVKVVEKIVEKIVVNEKINTVLELSEYRKMKENIIKEQICNIRDIEILEIRLNKLGVNMPECTKYADFIRLLISLGDKKNIKLVEYLKFISIMRKIPDFIKDIKCVKSEIELLQNVDIEKLDIDLDSEEKIIQLSKYVYETKSWLKEKKYYYHVINLILKNANKLVEEFDEDNEKKQETTEAKEVENLEKDFKKETIIFRNSIEDSISINNDKENKEEKKENTEVIQKYNGITTGYNALEILFYKIRTELKLYEIKIIKKSRIAGYKTVFIISKLSPNKNPKIIKDLENRMNELIIGEDIKIIPYSTDKREILSKVLDVEENKIILDEKSRHMDFVLHNNKKKNIDEDKEKMIILELFPYNKIRFFYKDEDLIEDRKELIEEKEEIKLDKKEQDAVESILDIFFKN